DEKVAPEATTTNGHQAGQVPVENPATGEVIAHVPDLSADEVREMARRGRAAQPGWEALGFAGRARVMLRMQKWLLDNAERVIEKPSEITPLTSLLMLEGLTECGMPENVFQVATGYGPTGAALVDEVDMIMFTGSTATGKKVMQTAAETLTPVSLELGGKDPMIVLSDADLERAANAATYYSMQNSG